MAARKQKVEERPAHDPVDYITLCNRLNDRLARNLDGRKSGLPFMVISTRTPVNLLGCTLEEFAVHMESQFAEGMSWKRMRKWHMDHIYPVAGVNVFDDTEVFAACNFRNLQPLWASDNSSKNDSITPETQRHFKALCEQVRQPWHRLHSPHPCDAYVPPKHTTAEEILADPGLIPRMVAEAERLAEFGTYGEFVPPGISRPIA
jgi:hypothetical protein